MINLSDQYNHTTTSSSFSLRFSPSKKTIPLKNYLSNSFSSLCRHDWTLYDLQYLFLLILGIFLFYIVETPGIMIKSLLVLLLFIGLCYSTMTRSFLQPFLPVVIWLILFYSCRFIPATKRPHIYVSVLPALENIIYGDNVSVIIAKNTNIAKDLLAWIPYGILHFSLPFLTSLGIWLVGIKGIGIKGVLPVFSRAFGYMNIAGVLTQLIFPCSPPWYEYAYGIDTPASYSIPGEAGGLKRIDKLFNSTTYEKAFSGSPMVFGAFPSLHSACAILQILFISYTLQQHKYNNQIYFIGFLYVIWIWWACMYFTHHYMVDLVGGGVYAIASFWFSWKWLPRIVVIEDENDQNDVQSDVINITIGNDNDVMENIRSNNKFNNKRWEYEEVQKSLGNDDNKFIIKNNINDNNNVHNNINDNDAFIIDDYNSNSRSRSISRSSSRDSSRGSSRSSSSSSSSKSSVGSNSRTNHR